MPTLKRPAIAIAALAMLSPALAEPWGTYTYEFEMGGQLFGAAQRTADDAYELTYDCTDGVGDSSIGILTPEPWDDTAAYASEVPTTFTIRGTTHSNQVFAFEKWQGKVALVIYDWDQADGFNALLKALSSATGTIEVSWFDETASFDAWGVAGAIAYARINCGL
jgi:hypothetical protein